MIVADADGGVELYHNNSKKFETSSMEEYLEVQRGLLLIIIKLLLVLVMI